MNHCKTCILPVGFPRLSFDENGVCALCNSHEPTPAPIGADILKDKILAAAVKDYDFIFAILTATQRHGAFLTCFTLGLLTKL